MTAPLRIGTRGSQLALWQAGEVSRLLAAQNIESTIHVIRTSGDRQQDVPLSAIGGKGVFIKELEEALVRNEVDVAVHSLKDVPSILPELFTLAAFLERADPRDAWVHPSGVLRAAVSSDAVIGTSAPRRRAQLRSLHPQFRLQEIRGNVDSRLAKAKRGEYDALILASAGLRRLGRDDAITEYFGIDELVPAAGQGTIVVEALSANLEILETVTRINHEESEIVSRAERGLLQQFGVALDCFSAIAVHATLDDEAITIRVFLSDLEGNDPIRMERTVEREFAEAITAEIAYDLIAEGALELLARGSAR